MELVNNTGTSYYCPAKPSSDNHPQPCCVAVLEDERIELIGDETFSGGFTYTGQNLSVRNTITLNGGNYIFNNCDVVFWPGAKILVKSGTVLYIYGGSHLYACDRMWEGIEVENGGYVLIYGNSIIEDAEIALDIEDGAYHFIYQATFNKNYMHVRLKQPSGSPSAAVQRIRQSKFLCQTTASIGGSPVHTNLLPPRQGEYTLSQISAVNVRGLLVGSSGNGNTFDHAVFGVSANGVPNVEVLHNEFTDVGWAGTWVINTPNNGSETIDIVYNEFLRSIYPVFCFDNGTTVKTNITDNKIEFDGMGSPPPTGMRGISVEEISMSAAGNYNHYNISRNDIFNATSGVYLENLRGNNDGTTATLYMHDNRVSHRATETDQGAGIRLNNVVEAAVVGNEVYHPTNAVNWYENGIRISGNGNAVFCNHLHDIGNGLWFDGYQTTQTEVATNTFYRNSSAILLNWGDIGPQPISSSYDPHDNKWTDLSWWDVGANRFTTYVLGTHSHNTEFRVRTSAPSVYYPDENDAADFGGEEVDVSVIGGSWQNSCEVFNGPSFKTDGSEEVTEQPDYLSVLAPLEAQSEREANQQWLGQYGLYDRLSRDEGLRASANELESFFAENATSNMGRLHDAVNGFQASRNGQAEGSDGLTALQQVQPVNSVEQTLKLILELLYANATDLAALSDNETEQMRDIAGRCPLDDGFGVYMARAALLKVDTFPRNYTHVCELAQPVENKMNKTGTVSEVGRFSVYPNPSSGLLTVEYQLDNNETGQIEVFDLSGRSVHGSALSSGSSTSQIRLENLQSGLYLLRIAINGRTELSERISVIR